jgi:hypothetical protein
MIVLSAVLAVVMFVGLVSILLLAVEPKKSVALLHPKE